MVTEKEKTVFGLIGFPLGHSFSKKYFTEKFEKEGLSDYEYRLFELEDIGHLPAVLRERRLKGLNVTIPYKEKVFPYLTRLDPSAERVGAVNVIHITDSGDTIGYNSDYFGFQRSLTQWLYKCREPGQVKELKALVLGTGGASKAVVAVLSSLKIPYLRVSRSLREGVIDYSVLKECPNLFKSHHLIINTTPLGMEPYTDAAPDIDYHSLGTKHLMYDLVYNPSQTQFMKYGEIQGATTKNGLEMLYLQAEKSWEIWNLPLISKTDLLL